jgi:transposase
MTAAAAQRINSPLGATESTQQVASNSAASGLCDTLPDAEILRSQPGLGTVLAARVLAEFGDDPTRYADVKARRNYAATSPITRASGTRRVVLARVAGNKRLRDALYLQAFSALSRSPGARAYYDHHRERGHTHHQALRALANRLVGILHGCLRHRQLYDETTAWPTIAEQQHAAAGPYQDRCFRLFG